MDAALGPGGPNYYYTTAAAFCQEEIGEKIKKVFFTKPLTNRAVCGRISLSRGESEKNFASGWLARCQSVPPARKKM
jgi:hypothetical protein